MAVSVIKPEDSTDKTQRTTTNRNDDTARGLTKSQFRGGRHGGPLPREPSNQVVSSREGGRNLNLLKTPYNPMQHERISSLRKQVSLIQKKLDNINNTGLNKIVQKLAHSVRSSSSLSKRGCLAVDPKDPLVGRKLDFRDQEQRRFIEHYFNDDEVVNDGNTL